MSETLTKAQGATLKHCLDWSAPYEIARRRQAGDRGNPVSPSGLCRTLGWLRNRGLVEYGACNDTWRATPAGRLALKEHPTHD